MDESETGKRSRLGQVRDFCADTSAHGLGRVAAAKSWPVRLFWIAIFISASVISIHQISLSFTAYFEYPTKTDFSIVIKEQLHFPAVTVCNINPFKQSEIEKTPFWRAMIKDEENGVGNNKKSMKHHLLVNIIRSHKENASTIGHQAEELIFTCEFPGNQQNLQCSHRNFSQHFDLVYGNCFTFNGSRARVTEPGHRQGLKFMLFIDTPEYSGMLADSVGALVTVHSPHVKPVIDENSIFVAPGSAVFVSLQTENISLLGHPYNGGNCTDDISYSQTGCIRACVAQEMKSKCGCASIVMREPPVCDSFNEKQAKCLDDVTLNQDFGNCSCEPRCNREHYIHSVSSSTWPSKTHMPQLSNLLLKKGDTGNLINGSLESARENMAQVNIHFATMQVKNVQQEQAITGETLLGDIGGQLGLFVGISFITLVEFLELLLRLILPRKNTAPNRVTTFDVNEG